jgi:hypothetical protein
MSLELAIEKNTAALHQLIAIMGAQPQPERKARAEKPAASKETPAETVTAEKTTSPVEETTAHEITLAHIQAAVTKLAAEKGRDTAVSLLKKYEATRSSDLDAKYYAPFIQAVNATLMVG